MNTKILGGMAVALALILGFIGAFRHIPSEVTPQVQTSFGGTSPDIASPYLNVGGIIEWYAHTDNLTQATTTICQLQSPAATSTLGYASLHIGISTSTATTFIFAKGATQYATTTNILMSNSGSIGSASEVNIVASSTMIFSPNQWFVISQAGNGAGAANNNFSETGSCQAKWTQISY